MANIIYYAVLVIIIGIILVNIAKIYKISTVIPLLIGGLALRYLGVFDPSTLPDIEPIIILTLSMVLFYAGLSIDINSLLRYAKVILILAVIGVFMFTAIMGYLTFYMGLGLSLASAVILGAVLAPTDPAALFAVIEDRVKLRKKIRTILVGESAFNDAAAFITVFIVLVPLFYEGGAISPITIVARFFWSMIGGGLSGLAVTYIIARLIENIKEETTTKILVPTSALLAYTVAEALGSSGVIAAMVSGLLFGNLKLLKITPLPKRELLEFFENINFLIEIFIFILLGALIDPLVLSSVAFQGLVIAVTSLFLVRPLVVNALTVVDRRINLKERTFIALAGSKGVTSGALALALATHYVGGLDTSQILILTFFTILLTVIFQGISISYLANKLEVEEKEDVLQELITKRNALREALMELVDRYSNGEISAETYRELSAEIRENIALLEREIGFIMESKRRRIEKLSTQIALLRKQREYLDKLFSGGNISAELHEKLTSELDEKIENLEIELKELTGTTAKRE